jgi:Xaa-Pro aminopeptidase
MREGLQLLSAAPTLPERLCNLDRLLETMQQRQLDGLVCLLRPNVYYLSSFMSTAFPGSHETNSGATFILSRWDPDHPVLCMADNDVAVFVDRRTWVEDIRPYASIQLPYGVPVEPGALGRFIPEHAWDTAWGRRSKGRYEEDQMVAIRGAIRDLGLTGRRVGCDDLRLASKLAADGLEVVDAYGTLHFVRSVKTPGEIEIMRHATEINQAAISATIRAWAPGMTYRELTRQYGREVIGRDGFVQDPGGINVANPPYDDPAVHQYSGVEDFVIQPGTSLMLDCHGTWNQYCWDGGKTWMVDSEPTAEFEHVGRAAAEAVRVIERTARPGEPISELYARGRQVFERSGLPIDDRLLVYIHALGLDHVDQELEVGRPDWIAEQGMVLSTHVIVRGDQQHRLFLEDVGVLTPDGVDAFFSWNLEPIAGRGEDS